jgi:predicted ATPase/class 3 adenylate cyclase
MITPGLEILMSELPSGIVTFFFTDIEGSTPLWERDSQVMRLALERHNAILRHAIESHQGFVFKIVGDSYQAAFALATEALAAAIDAQLVLAHEEWGATGPLHVRMGLHTGHGETRGDDYVTTSSLYRVARIMSAAYGDQILLSQETADLVRRDLPEGVSLKSLGEHRLKGLSHPEHLFQVITPELRQDFPFLPTQIDHPNNLPVQLTSFVGRVAEIAEVCEKLLQPEVRLLTLTGVGGIGKTRICIQVGQRLLDAFPDGVFFVALAPIEESSLISSSILTAFGIHESTGRLPIDLLTDYLAKKQLLLILDNFEHLIDPGSIRLVLDILEFANGVKILVTSRTRLNVQGEQLFTVSGLETPPEIIGAAGDNVEKQAQAYTSLELFVERARRIIPNFQLTRENMEAVIRICQFVEGAPLGIELAAVWLEILSPDDIYSEITRSLDFLETNLEDVPQRHRSLRAVFESSWKMLAEDERLVIQKLSVCQGSFTHQAAIQISGATLHALLGLANKSWLEYSSEGRFQLHESLRMYANESLRKNLEVWRAAKDAHSHFFVGFVESQGRELRGKGQINALQAIASEFNSNIRTAFSWLIERQQFEIISGQLLPGLFHFCLIRSLGPEIIPLVRQARLALENADSRENQVRLAILMTAETYLELRHDISNSQPKERLSKTWAMLKESQLAEDMGFWLIFLAREYTWEISFDDGGSQLLEILPRIRSRVKVGGEDPWVLGCNLMFLGRIPLEGLTDEEKIGYLNEALAIFQEGGCLYEQALVFLSLGDTSWRLKKSILDSKPHYQAARELFERVDDPFGVATIWRILAEIHLLEGDFEQAYQAYQEEGQIYERIGSRHPPSGSVTLFGSRDFE